VSRGSSVYVGLLRGVNVGGKNKLPMADLRSLCEHLGWSNVRTFIQSGNVIFTSENAPKALLLEVAIEERFAMKTNVLLRTASDLVRAVKRSPFAEAERAYVHVAFVSKNVSETVVTSLDHERFTPDKFAVIGSEVYLYLPNGVGQSKLPAYLVRQLKVPVTIRNWNTVNKLAELAVS